MASADSLAAGRTYLNESAQFSIIGAAPNNTLPLRSNITLYDRINHTFEGKSTGASNWDVEYVASNTTGFLLRFRIDNEAGTADDKIQKVDCSDTSDSAITTICDSGCGGNDFGSFHTFTIMFNSTSLNAKMLIDGNAIADPPVCTNATMIGSVRFSRRSPTSAEIQNNLLLANNLNPILNSNLPNITWPEDTSTSFNISGNFSDPNNDTLSFSLLSGVDNITIIVNSSTGVVNFTPSLNFFGVRYAIFLANDSDNITYSNNVTLNVTPLNDFPTVFNVILGSTDFLNRSNGTLTTGWTFNDPDNEPQQGNQTLWYVNGSEKVEFRNLTAINSSNLTKTQSWIFSVSASDGTSFSDFVNSTSFLIQNSAPTQSIPTITSNDEHSRRNGTLTCNNQTTNDVDRDSIANFISWHKNNIAIETAANLFSLKSGNYSKNDNITCEIIPYDGTVNGTSLNSTIFAIRNAAPILNNSIQDKTWNQDTFETINLNLSFVDIDNENLTYNYTNISNIGISINNATGIVTLTPDSGFSGARYIIFFAFDGANLTSSNNVTLTVNAVSSSSPSGSSGSVNSGGSGGGGGSSGYQCSLDWQCDEWSVCIEGKQSRNCKLVQVPDFLRLDSCPQNQIPEQGRQCAVLTAKDTCEDNIKNQDETGIDCGGVCKPCILEEQPTQTEEQLTSSLTGAAVAEVPGSGNIYLILAIILLAASLLFYAKFSHDKIFRKEKLSKGEMEKLNKMLNYSMFKK
ncbi:hypothetical protein HYS31_03650 [Candidatus Woesearchaeota archaeon]|nr:hypothetical protein [Candidatus Woesearchaeota archaeon]